MNLFREMANLPIDTTADKKITCCIFEDVPLGEPAMNIATIELRIVKNLNGEDVVMLPLRLIKPFYEDDNNNKQ